MGMQYHRSTDRNADELQKGKINMDMYEKMGVNPLSLMETLADEAVYLAKMDMDLSQEVALYEQGIRLTAKAWKIPSSFPEELLQEIQGAKTAPRTPPELKARPVEVTRSLILNLYSTDMKLRNWDERNQMRNLIDFAVYYPEPLRDRYQEATEISPSSGMTLG